MLTIAQAKLQVDIGENETQHDALLIELAGFAEARVSDLLGFPVSEFEAVPLAVVHAQKVVLKEAYFNPEMMETKYAASGLSQLDQTLNSLLMPYRRFVAVEEEST